MARAAVQAAIHSALVGIVGGIVGDFAHELAKATALHMTIASNLGGQRTVELFNITESIDANTSTTSGVGTRALRRRIAKRRLETAAFGALRLGDPQRIKAARGCNDQRRGRENRAHTNEANVANDCDNGPFPPHR
jgi:hypothetical protein